jgi:hypothetical protein
MEGALDAMIFKHGVRLGIFLGKGIARNTVVF